MIIAVAIATFSYFSLFFLISYFKRDISFIDVGWGPSFSFTFIAATVYQWPNIGMLQTLVGVLVLAWSARLAIYLHGRNRSKGEDPRYTELAKHWKGNYWVNAYFRVFMIQGLLQFFIAAPILFVMNASVSSLTITSFIGAAVALTGLIIEALADYQMSQFQKLKPKPSKFCRLGLWRHSRHPNYFGEITFWFGVSICALNLHYGFVAMLGPLLLTFLLLKVSGVPMIENKYKDHPEWPAYEASTRVLLPVPR